MKKVVKQMDKKEMDIKNLLKQVEYLATEVSSLDSENKKIVTELLKMFEANVKLAIINKVLQGKSENLIKDIDLKISQYEAQKEEIEKQLNSLIVNVGSEKLNNIKKAIESLENLKNSILNNNLKETLDFYYYDWNNKDEYVESKIIPLSVNVLVKNMNKEDYESDANYYEKFANKSLHLFGKHFIRNEQQNYKSGVDVVDFIGKIGIMRTAYRGRWANVDYESLDKVSNIIFDEQYMEKLKQGFLLKTEIKTLNENSDKNKGKLNAFTSMVEKKEEVLKFIEEFLNFKKVKEIQSLLKIEKKYEKAPSILKKLVLKTNGLNDLKDLEKLKPNLSIDDKYGVLKHSTSFVDTFDYDVFKDLVGDNFNVSDPSVLANLIYDRILDKMMKKYNVDNFELEIKKLSNNINSDEELLKEKTGKYESLDKNITEFIDNNYYSVKMIIDMSKDKSKMISIMLLQTLAKFKQCSPEELLEISKEKGVSEEKIIEEFNSVVNDFIAQKEEEKNAIVAETLSNFKK